MDCAQILSNLHVGSFPRSKEEIDDLLETRRTTAVVNLQSPADMRRIANFDRNDMRTHYGIRGIRLFHLPIEDLSTEDLQRRLPDCVLEALIVSGHSIYLHCSEGWYRSPTVAVAYLHWSCGWSLKKAEIHVKGQRDCAPDLEAIRLAKPKTLSRAAKVLA